MSSDPVKPVSSLMETIRARGLEHQRRMEEDPTYRAEQEAKEAEARRVYEVECAASLKQRREERLQARRTTLGIPQRVWPLLDRPEETAALQAAREFLTSKKTILILAGGVGTGKTVASAVVCDPAVSIRLGDMDDFRESFVDPVTGNVRFVGDDRPRPAVVEGRMVKALDLARAGMFGEESEIWDVCRVDKLLAIDDLGTEPKDAKGYYLASLFALLDHRYDWVRKTILTTNLSLEDFKATYCVGPGLRFLDRMREAGEFVNIAGKSMRVQP